MEFYHSREEKPQWIVTHFNSLFEEGMRVLDVGCDRKQLADPLPAHVRYTGIDVTPEADAYCNLDEGKNLPFQDGEFDIVIALDTLEHLEQIHFVLGELMRVSKRRIIISLPNSLFSAVNSYLRGKKYAKTKEEQKQFGLYTKQYGLPLEAPRDRHRWFFNTEEAENFIRYRAEKNGWEIKNSTYAFDVKSTRWKKIVALMLAGFQRRRALNFFNWTTIFVLERASGYRQ